jgi:hypothetical protein
MQARIFWRCTGKKYFDLYDKICHPLNLWAAYKAAAHGKRYQPAVAVAGQIQKSPSPRDPLVAWRRAKITQAGRL